MRALAPDAAGRLVGECLALAGGARLRVRGGCLEPRLREGERVRLLPPAERRPRFGDLVLTRHPDGLRLHRVIWPLAGRPRRGLRTQADRAPGPDAPVAPEALLAVVAGVERGGGLAPSRDCWRAALSLARAAAGFLRRRTRSGLGY